MKGIPLTRGLVALVDDEDYEELAQYKWCAVPGDKTFYAARNIYPAPGQRKFTRMHRVILGVPGGQDVDHKDGDGLNNQRANLRPANDSLNNANRVRLTTNTSGRRGVSLRRYDGRWIAAIRKNGKLTHLGAFIHLDDAARAYDTAARELFGEYARPNFPEITSAAQLGELMRGGKLQGWGE